MSSRSYCGVLTGAAIVGLLAATLPARAEDPPPPSSSPRYSTSPAPEFDGFDVMALVNRERAKTDCKTNWTKDGKLYCFASADAKAEFLKAPDQNIATATDMYAAGDLGDIAKGMEKFESGDANEFIDAHIEAQSKANGGVFVVADPLTATSLPLVYDGVDFTRTLKGYGFFPDVKFHAKDDPQKKYLVDFWVAPKAGQLTLLETRIYKTPVKDGADWVMMQRQPKPWWWIPAAEHPGETEQKRSWEVMSSIEQYIIGQTHAHDGVFTLKDGKTGEDVPLEFVDVHQPVRRLKSNGRYFACTDFRKRGTTDQFYDIDFWLDSKTGKVSVSDVRVHKVPFRQDDGSYTQIPRYNFDSKTFDQVP